MAALCVLEAVALTTIRGDYGRPTCFLRRINGDASRLSRKPDPFEFMTISFTNTASFCPPASSGRPDDQCALGEEPRCHRRQNATKNRRDRAKMEGEGSRGTNVVEYGDRRWMRVACQDKRILIRMNWGCKQ